MLSSDCDLKELLDHLHLDGEGEVLDDSEPDHKKSSKQSVCIGGKSLRYHWVIKLIHSPSSRHQGQY